MDAPVGVPPPTVSRAEQLIGRAALDRAASLMQRLEAQARAARERDAHALVREPIGTLTRDSQGALSSPTGLTSTPGARSRSAPPVRPLGLLPLSPVQPSLPASSPVVAAVAAPDGADARAGENRNDSEAAPLVAVDAAVDPPSVAATAEPASGADSGAAPLSPVVASAAPASVPGVSQRGAPSPRDPLTPRKVRFQDQPK